MITFTIIFLVLLCGALGYLVYVQQQKYNKLLKYTEAYIKFIGNVYFMFKVTQEKLKEVDRRGSFEADDEVGFVFKDIQNQIDILYTFISKYVNQEEKEKSK
jgi:hypothetical protein